MRGKMIVRIVGVASLLGSLVLAGCGGGGTDGGGSPDFTGQTFVGGDASGTLTLSVSSTSVPVASTATFSAVVKDANGAAVPQIQIACDSEQGLAIIEPSSGFELTDSFGNMSGIVGCSLPGSFQMACRLPIGANKQKYVTIHCTGGAVPAGFDGFPGAGGGGLGGGVQTPDDGGEPGGTGTDGLRIAAIELVPSVGEQGTTAVDTAQRNCEIDPNEDPNCEPFGDDLIQFTVQNDTNQIFRFSSYTYTVPEATDTGGASFTSKSISLVTQNFEVLPQGDSATVTALFTEAISGAGTCGLEKRFADAAFSIGDQNSGDLGFRAVTFRLNGTNESGDAVTLTASSTFSFDAFDNCG